MKQKELIGLTIVLSLTGLLLLQPGCGSKESSDATPPSVVSVSPAQDEGGVSVDSPIIVTFSEAMDQAPTEAAFSLSASPAVSGSFSWSAEGNVLTFTPEEDLVYANTYTVAVDSGAQDLAGNALADAFSSTFIVEETAGILDTGFDSDGVVVHNGAAGGNGNDYGEAIAIDAGGKILVAGYSRNASGNYDMVIWRYNRDGSLDTSFDSDGIVVHNGAAGGNGDDYGRAITIDEGGKILVAGESTNASGNYDMVIWRYNQDGSLDMSFDSDGIVVHDNAAGGNSHDYGYAITIDAGGKILVAGYSSNDSGNSDMVIWRYR